jgi:hypothetical protein
LWTTAERIRHGILVEFSFKVHRRLAAERVSARGENLLMDQAAFERAPEAFHHGVVVSVAALAHAGDNFKRASFEVFLLVFYDYVAIYY